MVAPTDRITKNGQTLSARVWALIEDAGRAAGMPIVVTQGAYKNGSGASASAGTHDGAGAADLRTWVASEATVLRLVDELRRRNCAAWYRAPAYGWPASLSGPHIHLIVKDEPGLSPGAQQQVRAYDQGKNGLANNGPDPHPRPPQKPCTMEDEMALSDEDVQRIAEAVWQRVTQVDGVDRKMGAMLAAIFKRG